MSIKRLFDAVERRRDIARRVAALVLPISNRPRVTSSCAGKIGLREPGEHTSGPNLASRDNVAHNWFYIRFWKRRHRSIPRLFRGLGGRSDQNDTSPTSSVRDNAPGAARLKSPCP
jgi:hypothetical protein